MTPSVAPHLSRRRCFVVWLFFLELFVLVSAETVQDTNSGGRVLPPAESFVAAAPSSREVRPTQTTKKATDLTETTVDGYILNIPSAEISRTVISLNGGRYQGIPNKDGTFAIHAVPAGSYILTAVHPTLVFHPLLLEVSSRHQTMKISVSLYSLEHGKATTVMYPLKLTPASQQSYFMKREEFNVLALVKNPMMLIGLVCMGLMVLLPKVQSSLDPEALQEMSQAGGALGGGGTGGDGAYVSPFVQAITNAQSR
eukprot:GHVS01018993.1.p1 GENE.GHVS01018993.1~~GHVS01018993.1.p1  ORF type:complete len:255 (-),score=30.19 GHVS01018993.1:119-883(-)